MKDAIPDQDGVVPPIGYVLVKNKHGERFWVSPDTLKMGPRRSELTDDQVRRIVAYKQILGDHDSMSLQEALDGFRRDAEPDKEIRVFEHIANVYQQELTDRPDADDAEQLLLYRVIMTCSFSANVDDILGMLPAAKSLYDLGRVVARYRGNYTNG